MSFLCLLVLCISLSSAQEYHKIYKNATRIVIGMSTYDPTATGSSDPLSRLDAAHGIDAVNAVKLYLNKTMPFTQGMVRISGVNYPVEFQFLFHNSSDAKTDEENHEELCKNSEVIAIIGSVNRLQCERGTQQVIDCGKVAVTGCALIDKYTTTNPTTFAVAAHAPLSIQNFYPYLRISQIKKIAILCANHPYTQTLCAGANEYAPQHGLRVELYENITNDFYTGDKDDCIAKMQMALDAGAEALILMAFESCVGPMMTYLRDTKQHFKLVLAAPDRDYSPTGAHRLPLDVGNYITVLTKTHPDLSYNDSDIGTYSDFLKTYVDYYAKYPLFFAAYYYVAAQVIMRGLQKMNLELQCPADQDVLFTATDLAASISKLDFESITGRTVWDSQHRSLTSEALVQVYDGESHVVAPTVTQFHEIYVAPPWIERYYDASYRNVEIGFLTTCSILALISIIFIIIVVVYRDSSLMAASMPIFLVAMLIGSIFVYCGVFIWTVHSLTTLICHLRVWLISIGFVLIYGCMLTKTFRVWYLWSSASSTGDNVVITNKQLYTVIAVSIFIMTVFLALYSAVGGVKHQMKILDPHRQFYNQESCEETPAGKVILYVMFTIGIISLIAGFVFSFLTRKVSLLAFNESKQILFSVYNLFFFGILSIIVLHLTEEPEIQYILRSLCILLSSFATILIVLGQKLWYLSSDKTIRSRTKKVTNLSTKSVATTTVASKSVTNVGSDHDEHAVS